MPRLAKVVPSDLIWGYSFSFFYVFTFKEPNVTKTKPMSYIY